MMESYVVTRKSMTLPGGIVREPGDLVPEAVHFSPRVKTRLIDGGLITRVVVVTAKEFKKLEGTIKSSSS